MRLEKFKGITAHICERLGFEVTENQVRAWADRDEDPIPLDPFAGSMGANSDDVDAWIERNRGKRQTRRKSTESGDSTNPAQLPLMPTLE